MISLVVAGGQRVWRRMESAVEIIEVWFRTRRWELTPSAIPACVVASLLFIVIVGERSKSAVAIAEPYRQQLRTALDAKDYQRAEIFLRKLTDLNVADDHSRIRLAMLAQSVGKSDEALEQIEILAPRMKVGFPLARDSLLGTEAAGAGQLDDARTHLERAWQQSPNNPALLNNLAWVLAHSQPPDLERAFDLANSAARLLPRNAEIRETRGQILLRLRQPQAAIADLELALPNIQPQLVPAIHAALAEAYALVGDLSRAQQHRGQVPVPLAETDHTQDEQITTHP